MPLYEFRCRACEVRAELRLPAGEAPGSCPACGAAQALERVWSAPGSYRGPGLKGAAAARSDDARRRREDARWEGFRRQREQLGLPPRGPSAD